MTCCPLFSTLFITLVALWNTFRMRQYSSSENHQDNCAVIIKCNFHYSRQTATSTRAIFEVFTVAGAGGGGVPGSRRQWRLVPAASENAAAKPGRAASLAAGAHASRCSRRPGTRRTTAAYAMRRLRTNLRATVTSETRENM